MSVRVPQLIAWLAILAFVFGLAGAYSFAERWAQVGCGLAAYLGLTVTLAAIVGAGAGEDDR